MGAGVCSIKLRSRAIAHSLIHRRDAVDETDSWEDILQKFERSVSLLAWGLNEEDLVEAFLDRAFALLEEATIDYEVVFVDDGSTDRMPELLAAYAKKEPRLRIVRHDRNYNVGIACRTAIANAGKEFLFWQTVDWSYDLTKLRVFLELLNHFDVVQGIRPVPIRLLSYIPVLRSIYRVNKRSDTFRKAIVSLGNYYLLRILFGAKFQDFQNITFYPTKFVQSLSIGARTSFINPELLLKSYGRGIRIIEVPIRFIPRTQGEAKGTRLAAILRSVADTFRNWLAWGIGYRRQVKQKIWRVSEPFALEREVLELVIPLFEDFR
jgi:glycosyltransferase involved in cell wall biosynthesis